MLRLCHSPKIAFTRVQEAKSDNLGTGNPTSVEGPLEIAGVACQPENPKSSSQDSRTSA